MLDRIASALASWLPRRAPAPAPAQPAARPRAAIRGSYDLARTTAENRRHWAQVDGMSARNANSTAVRYTLRVRCRYAAQNNSYVAGIVSTLANDTVGTGPRLQLLTPDPALNRAVEAAFSAWSDAVGLPEKLRTLKHAQVVDGEAFAVFITNPRLGTPVQLDLKLVEADQVTTPFFNPIDPYAVDGILFDHEYNPVLYHVLKFHPGDLVPRPLQYDPVPASQVLHYFKATRPQQARGVPEITPAADLCEELRRFTLAVIAAAETAADFAAVLYTEMTPDQGDGSTADEEPFQCLEIERRMMTTLPAGWKMGQFKAEQPAATYQMFKHEIINEMARCLNMPYNIAAANSAGYNYSSGRLDHQTYYRSLKVDQDHIERAVLDRVLAAWLREARLAHDFLEGAGADLAGWPRRWLWAGHEHVDPSKEATAEETRLRNGTTSFSEICYRQGVDPDARAAEIAADAARFRDLGMEPPWMAAPKASQPAPAPGHAAPSPDPADEGDGEGDAEASAPRFGGLRAPAGLNGAFHGH